MVTRPHLMGASKMSTGLFLGTLACFVSVGTVVGLAIPVERTVHINRVLHNVPPPVKMMFKDRVVYKDKTIYVPVSKGDEYKGPAGTCERGNPVVIKKVVEQKTGDNAWTTWFTAVPVGQVNESICQIDGAYNDIIKPGMVMSFNTAKGM